MTGQINREDGNAEAKDSGFVAGESSGYGRMVGQEKK
jgi:hypothetical protein